MVPLDMELGRSFSYERRDMWSYDVFQIIGSKSIYALELNTIVSYSNDTRGSISESVAPYIAMTMGALRNLMVVYMDARMTAPNRILKPRELALLVVVEVLSDAGPGRAVVMVVATALVVDANGAAVVPKVRQFACLDRVTSITRLVVMVLAAELYSR